MNGRLNEDQSLQHPNGTREKEIYEYSCEIHYWYITIFNKIIINFLALNLNFSLPHESR